MEKRENFRENKAGGGLVKYVARFAHVAFHESVADCESPEENKVVVRRWIEEVNKRNLAALDELIAPDFFPLSILSTYSLPLTWERG